MNESVSRSLVDVRVYDTMTMSACLLGHPDLFIGRWNDALQNCSVSIYVLIYIFKTLHMISTLLDIFYSLSYRRTLSYKRTTPQAHQRAANSRPNQASHWPTDFRRAETSTLTPEKLMFHFRTPPKMEQQRYMVRSTSHSSQPRNLRQFGRSVSPRQPESFTQPICFPSPFLPFPSPPPSPRPRRSISCDSADLPWATGFL